MNRRDFVFGGLAGAVSTGLVGVAGNAIIDRGGSPAAAPPPRPEALPAAQPKKDDGQYKGRQSFSQQGEDLIVFNILHDNLKLDAPTYLDIGAGDPVLSNNTYLLYCTGSRGVLVEPNPTMVEKLKRVRPGDVVVNAGVGVTDTAEADYYVIRGQWPLNTFSLEDVAKLRHGAKEDPVEKVIKMPLIRMDRLIAEHFKLSPDYMSIDTEGMDLAILRSMDLRKYRPAVICAETKSPAQTHDGTAIARLLTAHGYVATAGSLYNTIFVDRKRLT